FYLFPIIGFAGNDNSSFDSRHTFLADLRLLKIGFTRDQVEKVMEKYLKGTNWQLFGNEVTIPGTQRETFEVDTTKKDQLTLKNCDVYRH
ncbi:MAG: hypothetical protein N839_0017150, partial [Desulfofustis sp. PB-SRB1]|nr:hypothetical protein [Desulfofustis sp. PB-SRB1]